MQKLIYKFSYCLVFALLFSSCEKVILIDLNSASPKIVIEAEIYDQSFCKVKISQTVNFDQPNTFPAVTGASIKLTDNLGNTETLVEASTGNYIGSLLPGTPGRTYTLEITANGKTFNAFSTMPQSVSIDTLLVETLTGHISGKVVEAKYTDPAGNANFYRFVLLVNNIDRKLIVINDDRLLDGELIIQPVPDPGEKVLSFNSGDSIIVQLHSIDKGVYEYFRTLKQLEGGGHGGSTAPANPQSNIDNGALGYFSASAIRSKTIMIQ
jgi:hypothetical protein